jgi:hypothetical protein
MIQKHCRMATKSFIDKSFILYIYIYMHVYINAEICIQHVIKGNAEEM